jgi:3-phenylpropionate/trans-cinnamate dioxygenase ferredoxin reductase component
VDSTHTTVVVGASLAGMHAARTLRLEGHAGPIVVLDADANTPYDKPPLSKQVLSQGWEVEKLTLPAAKEELDLDLRLGVEATGLDLTTRRVSVEGLSGPGEVAFDTLVLATGASARRLPGTDDIDGLHVVRTLDDALGLRADLEAGPSRVVVVGAGFIGAEVAASCRTLGLEVTLIEALPVPLERVLGAEMGAVCGRVHVEHGVDLRLGTGVDHFETIPSEHGRRRVTGVTLTDGTTVAAEVVVVGIGVAVNTGWLEGSGLTIDDGVVCDETLLAAPGVVAAGDIARYPSARFEQLLRVEHWEHAIQGGEAAARRLLAEAAGTPPERFDPVPWFWSDQYDRKIQLAGRPAPTDEVRVVHGSTEELRFVALYGRKGRLVGVLGMNRPRHVIQLRGLVDDGASFDEALERAAAL